MSHPDWVIVSFSGSRRKKRIISFEKPIHLQHRVKMHETKLSENDKKKINKLTAVNLEIYYANCRTCILCKKEYNFPLLSDMSSQVITVVKMANNSLFLVAQHLPFESPSPSLMYEYVCRKNRYAISYWDRC